MSKNNFGILLHNLIQEAGVKNINVSQAVGYDISYISKWLSGKMLPSCKNIEDNAKAIAACIVDSLDDEKFISFQNNYNCKDRTQLKENVGRALVESYYASKGAVQKKIGLDVHLVFSMTFQDMTSQLREAVVNCKAEVTAVVDLFSLDYESRLQLANIRDGYFNIPVTVPKSRFRLILNIAFSSENSIYDALYLGHMFSAYSMMDFKAFQNPFAVGKFIYSVDSDYLVSGFLFPEEKNVLLIHTRTEKSEVESICQRFHSFMNQDAEIFRKISMEEFIHGLEKQYVKSMLSTNIRWLVGHIMELILPTDVFEEFLSFTKGSEILEYRKLYTFSQSVLEHSATKIMLYESLFSEMLATGEMDFFNMRLEITPRQMVKCIDYFISLVQANSGAQIKLVRTGFYKDFKHLPSLCLFLSDSIDYLRLEGVYDRASILLLNDMNTRQLFAYFFEKAWTEREDVVTEDKDIIQKCLLHYRNSAELLSSLNI